MKKLLIYGLGKRFQSYFVDDTFMEHQLKKSGYEIIGLFDKNYINKTYTYKNQNFLIKSIQEWKNIKNCQILVTSKRFFEEIQSELCTYGFAKEQIILIDNLIEEFLNKEIEINLFQGKNGVEVGGPSAIFSNIYKACSSCDGVNFDSNTVWWEKGKSETYKYGNQKLGKIYIADATEMNCIENEIYDFVLSSNNLEHIANPIKAIKEFCRVLRVGGYIVILVPMKERSFDHSREYTSFEHIVDDYKKGIKEDDLSHLPEIIETHDYSLDVACGGKEAFIERSNHNLENRCLHHHVFSMDVLNQLFEFNSIEIIKNMEAFNNYWIIGKKI